MFASPGTFRFTALTREASAWHKAASRYALAQPWLQVPFLASCLRFWELEAGKITSAQAQGVLVRQMVAKGKCPVGRRTAEAAGPGDNPAAQTLVRTGIGVKAGAGGYQGKAVFVQATWTFSCWELHRGIAGSQRKELVWGRLPLLLVSVGRRSLAEQGLHCTWSSSLDVE